MTDALELSGKRIFIAGHRGMVGSAIARRLEAIEDVTLLTANRQDDADLREQSQVRAWMADNKPDVVIIAAATVGGIVANSSRPAEFIYDNLMIESNLVDAAYRNGVEKLMLLGSSCIYPKLANQPMDEAQLLTGPLEPTNQWYAVAKIAGIKLAQAYREQYDCDYVCAMPTNLYGAGDNFNLESAHAIPALMRKAHMAKLEGAKSLQVWGSGTVRREFLFVDDLAEAIVFLLQTYSEPDHVNIGTGQDVTIAELATLICKVVGFEGSLEYDSSKPDGTPRKLLDVSRINTLGWQAKTPLEQGLVKTYQWFLEHQDGLRT